MISRGQLRTLLHDAYIEGAFASGAAEDAWEYSAANEEADEADMALDQEAVTRYLSKITTDELCSILDRVDAGKAAPLDLGECRFVTRETARALDAGRAAYHSLFGRWPEEVA
jgi:hypothetical protein